MKKRPTTIYTQQVLNELYQRLPILRNTVFPLGTQELLNWKSPEERDLPFGKHRLWTRRVGEMPVYVDGTRLKAHGMYASRRKAFENPTDAPEADLEAIAHAIKMLERQVDSEVIFPREARPKIAALKAKRDDVINRAATELSEIVPTLERELFNDAMRQKLRDFLASQDPTAVLFSHSVAKLIGDNDRERSWIVSWFQSRAAQRQHLPEFSNGESIALCVDLVAYREAEERERQRVEAEKTADLDRRAAVILASL